MKRRALGAAFVVVLISALTGSVAWADNPHGTPPGQAANDQTTASVSASASASASAESKGQAKKAEESSQSSSSAGPSANASATAQANAAEHAQSNTQSTASTSTASSPSSDSQTKITPGGSKFDNCSGTPNTTSNPGVKPSNDTNQWTCATADSKQTKEYGNGTTAGQGVIARGGSPKTKLYGPGNSQPHMVAPCPGSRHMRDWHAVKNYNPASCTSSPGTSSSCSLQPGQVKVNGQCVWPCPNNQAMPASGQCGLSSNTTTVTTTTSVTNNSTTNNSVVNNSTTNNSTTNNSVTNNSTTNNSSTNNSSVSRNTPATSGVQGAQHSSSPKKAAAATAPASSMSPAASTAPASPKGVLGTSATPSSGSLPFTGLPLWLPALLAAGLAVGGFSLLRFGRSRA